MTVAPHWLAILAVSSGEPSSTTITSRGGSVCCQADVIACSTNLAPRKAGITTEIRNLSSFKKFLRGGWHIYKRYPLLSRKLGIKVASNSLRLEQINKIELRFNSKLTLMHWRRLRHLRLHRDNADWMPLQGEQAACQDNPIYRHAVTDDMNDALSNDPSQKPKPGRVLRMQ